MAWGLSAPLWWFWNRERGEGRKNRPENMKVVPKPLREADAPWSSAHEGAGVVAKVLLNREEILL